MPLTRFQPWGFGGSRSAGFNAPRTDSFSTQWSAFGYGGRGYGTFDRFVSRAGANFSTRFGASGFGERVAGDFTRTSSARDFIGPVQWQAWGYGGTPNSSFAGRTSSGRDSVGTITEWAHWGWGGRLHGAFSPRAEQIFNASIGVFVDFLSPTVGSIVVADGFNAALSANLADTTGAITMVQGALTFNAQITANLANTTGSMSGTVKGAPVNAVINANLANTTGSIQGSLGLLSNRMVVNANFADTTGAIVIDYDSLSFMQIDANLADTTGQIFMHAKEPDDGTGGTGVRSSGRIAVPTKMFDETGSYTEQGLDWVNKLTAAANVVLESGPTSSRPDSGLFIGRRFYDTTLGIEVMVFSVNPVVWKNSFGNVV